MNLGRVRDTFTPPAAQTISRVRQRATSLRSVRVSTSPPPQALLEQQRTDVLLVLQVYVCERDAHRGEEFSNAASYFSRIHRRAEFVTVK